VEPATVKSAAMEPATMEPAAVEPTTVEPTTAVEPAAPTMRTSLGGTCLAERSSEQQSSCSSSQSASHLGPNGSFA
jgi:hypothetical protein